MKITTKGQITIPQKFREQFGLLPHTEVSFVPDEEGLRIVKSDSRGERGRRVLESMLACETQKLSTDEVMKLTRGEE